MQMIGKLFKTAGIMLAGVLAGAVLLSLAFLVPVNETNQSASYDIIKKEGWYPAIPIVSASLDTYFHSLLPGVLDGSTDTIMLQTALEPDETNVLRAAMDMNQYDYYWHGYVTVLRPLLALFDYGEIRVLNSMGQLLLVFLLCLCLWRKKGMPYALLSLTSYFLLMPMAMPFSLQYSWVFYITAGCLLYLVWGDRTRDVTGMKLYWLFLAVGMLTSFFDLLTYPLYTWGVPVIWWLLLQETDREELNQGSKGELCRRELYYIKQVVCTGLWWILGYAGMWLGKFCLGSLILGRNIFQSAFYEVGFRLGVEEEPFGFSDRLEALYVNWKHYEYKLFALLLVVWLVFIIVGTLKKGVRGNVKGKALALAGVSPVVWYFALANHTAGHHFFTYRIYGIAVLAVLAILLGAVGDGSPWDRRRSVRLLCVWGICGIAACGLSLFAREEISVTNGDREYRQAELREGAVCEMSFTPSFPTVKRIGLCISTDAREGVCRIRLGDEELRYEEEILLSAYGESTYADIPVDWKLQRGKEYNLCISIENADGEAGLLVTANQDMPLSEYGEAWIDENAQDGQILSGLTYSYRPLSHFTLAFLAVTWTGILFAAGMVFVREKV